MTRPEPAQTCLCVQPQNTTIKRLHLFIYVREKLWDSSCFTFQDVIYRIPGWYLRVCPPPDPPHLSLSLSLYGLHYSCILQLTHLLQRGGRTFYNMWRFILSQIYLNAAETWILHMQDSQQRFRTWDSNMEIFRDEADFKALLIIEPFCTHLLTLLLPYMDVPDSRAARLCCQVRHCAATQDRV